eukprot:4039431-Amphidinium_carterae.1
MGTANSIEVVLLQIDQIVANDLRQQPQRHERASSGLKAWRRPWRYSIELARISRSSVRCGSSLTGSSLTGLTCIDSVGVFMARINELAKLHLLWHRLAIVWMILHSIDTIDQQWPQQETKFPCTPAKRIPTTL